MLTAGHKRRAFLLADIDIVEDRLHLLLGNHRAERRRLSAVSPMRSASARA